MSEQKDRITKYLSMLVEGMLFDELSDAYLENAGVADILKGVPVPVSVDESGDMTTLSIARNMAIVVGSNINYPYNEQYLKYIDVVTQGNSLRVMIGEGAAAADEGRLLEACAFFRAGLRIDPRSRDALYLYGRACKEAYEAVGADAEGVIDAASEEYIGNFKAESMETFEILTMLHPEFGMGYYFLGYAYLNMGLYTKAKLTWEKYMELSAEADETMPAEAEAERDELRTTIQGLLDELDEPVVIEQGINQIAAGDYQGGRETLLPYSEGRYEQWWPLWYYLAFAEEGLGNTEAAIDDLKKALLLSPSNTEVMEELVSLYEATGDDTSAEKYRRKIEIING